VGSLGLRYEFVNLLAFVLFFVRDLSRPSVGVVVLLFDCRIAVFLR